MGIGKPVAMTDGRRSPVSPNAAYASTRAPPSATTSRASLHWLKQFRRHARAIGARAAGIHRSPRAWAVKVAALTRVRAARLRELGLARCCSSSAPRPTSVSLQSADARRREARRPTSSCPDPADASLPCSSVRPYGKGKDLIPNYRSLSRTASPWSYRTSVDAMSPPVLSSPSARR